MRAGCIGVAERRIRAAALLLLLLCVSGLARADRPEVHVHHDPAADLSVAEARALWAAGRFEAVPDNGGNFGFRAGATWFAFSVSNPLATPAERLLVIEYTLLDHIELFRLDQSEAGPLWVGGDRQPFAARSLPLRYFNRLLQLAPRERATYLLRVSTESSLQVPIVVDEPEHYLVSQQSSQLGLGLYFGVLVALSALNAILFISVRDRNFLYYVIYVLSVGLVLLCLSGVGFQLFWPQAPTLANLLVLLSIGLALASMLQFTRRFLDLRRHFRLGDQLCLLFMGLCLIGIAAAFVLPYGKVVQPLTLLVFPIAALVYLCGLAVLRGYPPARYFLIAWTSLLVGIMLYASVSLGWLPRMFFTEYAIQIGSAAEMVLLSFALAYRINLLTLSSARLESEAREQLEQRVRERTADLDAALHRLESANRQLEEFSRRDGLTGCFNRRSFEHMLRRFELKRLEQGERFAVLMVDVDHFKQVNDQFGHLVGDDCLRHVAQLMEGPTGAANAPLCRYGGEEFVVLAQLDTPEAALALAESLRRRVAERPLISEGRHIPITVSVGVAMRGASCPGTTLDTVRQADEALYAAKQQGRNRCVLADG
jgi:diguanylate cyclase (GGDEF)-like protein